MIITDSHVHIFPESIAHAAVLATGRFYEGARVGNPIPLERMSGRSGTVDELLRLGKEAGIGRFMVFSTATNPHQVEHVNDFIAAQCAAHPEFVGLGTMHIEYPDMEKELDRIKALGLRGIKLHPDIQRFALDDERFFPLYEMLGEKNMLLIAHTGDYRFSFSGPERMERVAKQFPKTRFIGAHFGGWSEWDTALRLLPPLENVWVDTSSTFGFVGPEMMKRAISAFDRSRILFGTDYPIWEPVEEVRSILELGLPEDLTEDILGNNFDQLLSSL